MYLHSDNSLSDFRAITLLRGYQVLYFEVMGAIVYLPSISKFIALLTIVWIMMVTH